MIGPQDTPPEVAILDAQKIVDKAKLHLMLDHPFFGNILSRAMFTLRFFAQLPGPTVGRSGTTPTWF
jgi:hypothetical protein